MATVYKRTAYIGGTSESLDNIDGDLLSDGDFAFVMTASGLSVHELDASSGATESSPEIIAPDTNAGTKRWIQRKMLSDSVLFTGAIVPFCPGYFTNSSNGGFVNLVGNDAASINALHNPDGRYYCNGAALNISGSTYYNGTGRYLPNLTDDRFIMGDTVAGATGGSNTNTHTHTTGSVTLARSQVPNLYVQIPFGDCGSGGTNQVAFTTGCSSDNPLTVYTGGGGGPHNHGSTGSPTNTENRPKYITFPYLMQVF